MTAGEHGSTYTPRSSSSGDDSEDEFTDHTEEFDFDEETKTYSVRDWPRDVWKKHYDWVRHLPRDTTYDVDDGESHSWYITQMRRPMEEEPHDPVVLAHIAACNNNEKITLVIRR